MPVYLDNVLLRSSQGHACICSSIGSYLSLWLALQRLQIIINPARQDAGESEVRNLDFNNRLKDELDLKDEDFVLFNTGTRGRNPEDVVKHISEKINNLGFKVNYELPVRKFIPHPYKTFVRYGNTVKYYDLTFEQMIQI